MRLTLTSCCSVLLLGCAAPCSANVDLSLYLAEGNNGLKTGPEIVVGRSEWSFGFNYTFKGRRGLVRAHCPRFADEGQRVAHWKPCISKPRASAHWLDFSLSLPVTKNFCVWTKVIGLFYSHRMKNVNQMEYDEVWVGIQMAF